MRQQLFFGDGLKDFEVLRHFLVRIYKRTAGVANLCQFLSFVQGVVDMKINARVGATEIEADFIKRSPIAVPERTTFRGRAELGRFAMTKTMGFKNDDSFTRCDDMFDDF